MMYWILCAALIAGATSAPQPSVKDVEVQPQHLQVLQQFPSVVQMEFYLFWSTMDWVKECSATILTTRTMLTAASCVSGWSYEPRFRRFRAGSSERNTGGVHFYVSDRVNHPHWGTAYTADVSVVRTMTAVVYNPLIQQGSIASPGSWIPVNLRLHQPGWGRAQQSLMSNHEIITAPITSCGPRIGNFSSALNATTNILCGVTQNVASNFDIGAPWIFNGVTVGVVGGVNAVGSYKGLISADVAQYTEWVVNVVSSWW